MSENLDKKWEKMRRKIMTFMRKNKRRPSKHFPEERALSNWIKYNKRRYARGLMEEHHIKKFEKLMATAREYHHANQYDYPEDSKHPLFKRIGVQLRIDFDDEVARSGESDD